MVHSSTTQLHIWRSSVQQSKVWRREQVRNVCCFYARPGPVRDVLTEEVEIRKGDINGNENIGCISPWSDAFWIIAAERHELDEAWEPMEIEEEECMEEFLPPNSDILHLLAINNVVEHDWDLWDMLPFVAGDVQSRLRGKL